MRRILLASLFTVLLSTSAFSSDTTITTEQDKTTISTTSESTTSTDVTTTTPSHPTTETSSDQPPKTTTQPPETTTEPPETTQPPKTTTQPPKTTTQPPKTTTTAAPDTTTTTSAPVTTKAPEPTPPDTKICSFTVTQNNVTCIIAKMQVLFMIEEGSKKSYIAVTQNATSEESNCNLSNITQSLVLTEPSYKLTMIFEKGSDKAYVRNITFSYSSPEEVDVHYLDSAELFPVKVGNSYLCHSEEKLHLGTAANVTMQIIDIQLQSFGSTGKSTFGSAEECDSDSKITDAVPIAVACALIALIVVVLIAYLVGRQRSRQRGYQSV